MTNQSINQLIENNQAALKNHITNNDIIIQQAWEMATAVPNFDPDVYRKDAYGAWIKRSDYGKNNTHVSLGWIIENDKNLSPLQWENAEIKRNNVKDSRFVTAWGIKNIIKE